MNKIFLIQLAVSFLVGGGLIAFLSIMAERASEKVAGIIISFPSTIAISFLFISITTSPEKAGEAATVVPAAIGAMVIFCASYLYLSRVKIRKIYSILLCASVSLLLWFLICVPLAVWKFSSLGGSLLAYFTMILIGYYLITVKPGATKAPVLVKYTLAQKIKRGAFGGFIIALAVFISKSAGPFWGGVFAGFPAVFLSSLITIHYNYDSDFLFRVWRNVPKGTVTLLTFAVAAKFSFPAFGTAGGLVAAYLASTTVFYLLSNFSRKA